MAQSIPTPGAAVVATDLTLAVAGRTLLAGAGFAVPRGRKAALVGRNGSGKSTLLATIQAVHDTGRPPGHVEMRGSLALAPGTVLASPPQSPQLVCTGTARAYLDARAGEVSRAWNRCEELTAALAGGRQDDLLLAEYGEVLEAMQRLDGWSYPQRLAELTAGLGLAAELLERPISELSGGQATRLALAGVLLGPAGIVLLDEPSNNLDLPSLGFLARWIRESPAGLLLVSHDRELIDSTVEEVLEIEEHTARLRTYGGGYSFYAERRAEEREALLRRYADQEQRRARLEASARGVATRAQRLQGTSQNDFYRGKAARVARQAKAQQTRIRRETNRLAEPEPPARPRLTVEPPGGPRGLLLRATELGFAYAGTAVLDRVSVTVRTGDRLALLGRNGSGKSTLLRLLAGELAPGSGRVEPTPGVRIGHLAQEPAVPDRRASLLDFAARRFPLPGEQLRAILGKVLFADPASVHAGDVSLGELRRVECAALFAYGPDLALLDEPTNHLDLLSIEMLEAALAGYPGALVVVTHDRRFLDGLRPTATLSL